jgi:hypothetical protein
MGDLTPREVAEVRAIVRARLVEAWVVLGAPALSMSTGPPREYAPVIDPEALVTLSCAWAAGMPEIADALEWWAAAGGALLHPDRVQRFAALFPAYPSIHPRAVCRQPRWPGSASVTDYGEVLGSAAPPRLSVPAAVVLRARAVLGVNVKADACAMLALHPEQTAMSLAAMTGCSVTAARNALGYAVFEGWARGTPRRARRFFATPRLLSVLEPLPGPRAEGDWTAWAAALWVSQRLLVGPPGSLAAVSAAPPPEEAGQTLGVVTAWMTRQGAP